MPRGRGSVSRSGTKPSATVHGIACLSIRCTPRSRSDLVDAHQADRLAQGTRASGPTDAVDVVLRVPRQLEVHDDRQVLDIEAAGGDVGRDEHPDGPRLESLERARPLRLRPVAVDGDRIDAFAVQARCEPRGGELRAREDQHLVEVT